jgi:hypothetical protein
MENEVPLDDASIFNDITQTVQRALLKTHSLNPYKTGIARASFELALKQLV